MYDINKFILDQRLESRDPDGHWASLPHWSPRTANRMAQEAGLTLEEDHWEVIYCLRDRFRDHRIHFAGHDRRTGLVGREDDLAIAATRAGCQQRVARPARLTVQHAGNAHQEPDAGILGEVPDAVNAVRLHQSAGQPQDFSRGGGLFPNG